MKKILLIMFCMVLLIGTASAFGFDNKVTYSDNDLKVTIENAFGLPFFGSDLGTFELKSHSSVDEVKKVGQGYRVVMWYDFNYKELYKNGFGDIEFIDMRTGKQIERDYSFVYFENGKWLPYNSKDIPKGDIRIGLQIYVEFGDYVDGIWTISGKKINKHAVWTESLNANLIVHYSFEEGSGTLANNSVSKEYNLTGVNTPGWTSGIIGGATDLTQTSSEYWENTTKGGSLYPSLPFSVNVWYNSKDDGDNVHLDTVISKGSEDDGKQRFIIRGEQDFDGFQASVTNSAPTLITAIGTPIIVADDWYMYTLVANSTHLVFYVNGSEISSEALTTLHDSDEQTFWIGRNILGRYANGRVDEVSVWNRTITPDEVTQLYNGGSGIEFENEFGLTVTLLTHINNTNFTTNTLNFSVNVTDPVPVGITNVSLYINETIFATNTSTIAGNYSFDFTSPDGIHNYTLRAWGDDDVLYNASNGTLTFNVYTSPTVNTNQPFNNTNTTDQTVNFNATVISVFDIANVSLFLNGNLNGSNTSGISGEYIFVRGLPFDTYDWYIEVKSSNLESVNQSDLKRVFVISSFLNNMTFNAETFETASEIIIANITTVDDTTPTGANLNYEAQSISATVSDGDNYFLLSTTLDVPLGVNNNTFNFSYSVGTNDDNTYDQKQNVSVIELGLCNVSLIESYVNFSFKDEADGDYINATIDTSTWAYWLGDGSVSKELLYTNFSVNFNYTFCFKGDNRTMHNNRSLQYASIGYPQRKYDAISDLTNTTTQTILWLLSSADGIYSSIQVVDAKGNRLSSVGVTAERQFSGIWTVIGQEVTDDAGSVTFWLNPDYDHRFTFTSESCVGTTVTIRPTQTQYTQQLACDGTGEDFVTSLEGIRYNRAPVEGIIQTGIKNFTYFITSSKYTIINATLQVINASDSSILNASTTTCNSDECIVYFIYDVQDGDNLKGKYYFDVGNGSILLEADAHWVNVGIDTEGKGGMGTFWKDMRYVIDEWGDDSATADFNRILIVFFFICIAIAFLNFHTGIDTQNPGAFMVILTFVIVSGSLVGGIDGEGFFYYTNNLTGIHFLNNYILALFCIIITFSYLIRTNIQANR